MENLIASLRLLDSLLYLNDAVLSRDDGAVADEVRYDNLRKFSSTTRIFFVCDSLSVD